MNTQRPLQTPILQALLLSLFLLTASLTLAQTKVVVVPMAGEQLPRISHPIDSLFINSIGMRFHTLPAGSFTMGSPVGEPGRRVGEVQHTVTLTKAFRMQVTEVTNGHWNTVIVNSSVGGANPSGSHSQANKLDSHPVERVTWFDSVFFANQLSIDEGRSACYTFSGQSGTPGRNLRIASVTSVANCTGYRLPTEAEWEYAARAGTTTAYANPIGFDSTVTVTNSSFNANLHAMGWYGYNRGMRNSIGATGHREGTVPVARKKQNAWGLYDMHGNVAEWTGDFFEVHTSNAETDPTGPATGTDRTIRGGSWRDMAQRVRSASRVNFPPSNLLDAFGFRLVLTEVQETG